MFFFGIAPANSLALGRNLKAHYSPPNIICHQTLYENSGELAAQATNNTDPTIRPYRPAIFVFICSSKMKVGNFFWNGMVSFSLIKESVSI
jgi:hypothetical protein